MDPVRLLAVPQDFIWWLQTLESSHQCLRLSDLLEENAETAMPAQIYNFLWLEVMLAEVLLQLIDGVT